MTCTVCGAELAEGAQFCQQCGSVLQNGGAVRQMASGVRMTRKEFNKLPGLKNYRISILFCAILCFIGAAASLLLGVTMPEIILFSLLDVAVYAGCGIWLLVEKNKVPAIIVTAYAAIMTVVNLVLTGQLTGWLTLLAGVWAIISAINIEKQWNQYQQSGQLPQ